ncbi:hypothetical protein PbB2_00092 [Candidatus Phycosocius bacilliformis]|uniref:Uncharacterized protein n=1 Tax=Candidatus Phycosocius bacilliformis TaxID=1445552 RepID=A0A2P2E5U3_9PROT|nr:DUF6441 family protein [Candidatus Phycosocius bacilliformis]GBF56436.1 hypothetical protein PbB2_00092 [Candidatus Phycosocius bacilliformis]
MIRAKLDMSGFEARRDALAKAPLIASKQAINGGVIALKERLRADVARAFGKRMDYTWASEVYPAGNRLANNPAGLVFSRAPKIVESFEYGANIEGGRAGALYIPIPGTPADKKRTKGKSLVREMVQRYGAPLELPQKDGTGWLLLFRARTAESGKLISPFVRTDRNTGQRVMAKSGVKWQPFFVVEPRVTLAPRLNARQIISNFEREWPEIYVKILTRVMRDA